MKTQNQKRGKQSRKSEDPTLIAPRFTPKFFYWRKCSLLQSQGWLWCNPSAPAKSHRKRTSPTLLTFCKPRQHVNVIWFYLFDFVFPVSHQAALKSLQDLKQWKAFNQIPFKMRPGPRSGSTSNYTCKVWAKSLKENGNTSIPSKSPGHDPSPWTQQCQCHQQPPPGLALLAQNAGKTFCFIKKLHSGAKGAAPPRPQSWKTSQLFTGLTGSCSLSSPGQELCQSTALHIKLVQG